MQIELLLLIVSETFFDSSVVPSFLVIGKLGKRPGNCGEIIAVVYELTKITQEKCSPIGHNNTKHFFVPNQEPAFA